MTTQYTHRATVRYGNVYLEITTETRPKPTKAAVGQEAMEKARQSPRKSTRVAVCELGMLQETDARNPQLVSLFHRNLIRARVFKRCHKFSIGSRFNAHQSFSMMRFERDRDSNTRLERAIISYKLDAKTMEHYFGIISVEGARLLPLTLSFEERGSRSGVILVT
ncbi:hypothetical protein TNCV_2264611 [Trichonephila clavipes]|nr:hypothetical protein TNCV_2264611 [Trichonephila clavipes]